MVARANGVETQGVTFAVGEWENESHLRPLPTNAVDIHVARALLADRIGEIAFVRNDAQHPAEGIVHFVGDGECV